MHQLVLPVLEPRYRAMSKRLFGIDLEKLNKLVLCSDYEVLIKLVLSGEFVTAGPRFAFHDEINRGDIRVMILDERVKHRVYLITNRNCIHHRRLVNAHWCIKETPNVKRPCIMH